MGFSMIINGEYPLDAVESPSPAPPVPRHGKVSLRGSQQQRAAALVV